VDWPALIEHFPALLKEIYGDLAKPGVRQVGKALGTIIGLGNTMLMPLALKNEKARIVLETNLNRYREKLESVPDDQISEVAPEVGVPIVEKLLYVTNEELSEMYTELLAKASQHQKANMAHPSFVNIINNMSPDEAILLKEIRPMINGIPFIEARLTKKGKNEWHTLNDMIPGLPNLDKLQFPNNVRAYLSNLAGMGLLQIRHDQFMVGVNIYEPLEESAKNMFSAMADSMPDRELTFPRGKIEITTLGHLFISACFSS
jgi:hypothetical protein